MGFLSEFFGIGGVPSYDKLGKETKDLFEEHFNVGQVKIDVKNKISGDLGFDFTGACASGTGGAPEEASKDSKDPNKDSNKVTSALETKYNLGAYGFQIASKWTTDNELTSEITIADSALIDGLKLSFITMNTLGETRTRAGTMKVCYAGPNYHLTSHVDYEGQPKLTSSAVFKYAGYTIGVAGLVDVKGKKVHNQNMAIQFTQGGALVQAFYDFKAFNVGFIQGNRGFRMAWGGEGGAKISYAIQQTLDGSSTLKAKLNSVGQLGLAYIYQYQPGVKVSLSSMVEAKNLFTGGHKIGLGLTFEG